MYVKVLLCALLDINYLYLLVKVTQLVCENIGPEHNNIKIARAGICHFIKWLFKPYLNAVLSHHIILDGRVSLKVHISSSASKVLFTSLNIFETYWGMTAVFLEHQFTARNPIFVQ